MFYFLFYEVLFRQYANQLPVLKILNVFQYVTFRTAYAAVTALVVSLLFGPYMIRKLAAFKYGQEIREEGPASHQIEAGNPDNGGRADHALRSDLDVAVGRPEERFCVDCHVGDGWMCRRGFR